MSVPVSHCQFIEADYLISQACLSTVKINLATNHGMSMYSTFLFMQQARAMWRLANQSQSDKQNLTVANARPIIEEAEVAKLENSDQVSIYTVLQSYF